jgi:regulator of protease activity HflC (stomatin/prohibitin superfamily)
MTFLIYLVLFVIVFIIIPGLKVVKQFEKGVVFRFGRIVGVREPGLNFIIPYIEQLRRVDMRTVTLPVPPQKIITKDNVSIDVSAVAYYKIIDAVKSIVAIVDVMSAINQISQTSVRKHCGASLSLMKS